MRDIVHGDETLVIDMITREVGEPDGVYEGAYGATKYYVWGVKLDSPSRDAVHKAPFSAGMIQHLTCGDYAENSVEFYTFGERIRP
jgi:hypothetical protein